MGGHLLMLPAMVLAMWHRAAEYTTHRPPPTRSGPWAAVLNRWPTAFALLVTVVHHGLLGTLRPTGVFGTQQVQVDRGQVKALELAGLSAEQVRLLAGVPTAVDGPARALLRDRLRGRVLRARQRWYHPSRPGFGDGEPFL